MAEFGISMDGRAPVTDIPAQAKAAEEGGASTLWIACHLFLRDPITMAALALGAIATLAFRKGLAQYARVGSRRYTDFGHSR